jgi:hypothetical protein
MNMTGICGFPSHLNPRQVQTAQVPLNSAHNTGCVRDERSSTDVIWKAVKGSSSQQHLSLTACTVLSVGFIAKRSASGKASAPVLVQRRNRSRRHGNHNRPSNWVTQPEAPAQGVKEDVRIQTPSGTISRP